MSENYRGEWLTVYQASVVLGVSTQAVRQLINRGTIAARRNRTEIRGGWPRYSVNARSVDAYLNHEKYEARTRRKSAGAR